MSRTKPSLAKPAQDKKQLERVFDATRYKIAPLKSKTFGTLEVIELRVDHDWIVARFAQGEQTGLVSYIIQYKLELRRDDFSGSRFAGEASGKIKSTDRQLTEAEAAQLRLLMLDIEIKRCSSKVTAGQAEERTAALRAALHRLHEPKAFTAAL